ncbi:Gfo/Idh/MocA family protein [Planctomycetaceae bacterium SH139]
MKNQSTRRAFMQRVGIASGAMAMSAASYSRVWGANDRLRIASVGTGGKGWSDLMGVAASPAVDVTGLCDIDSSIDHVGRAAEQFPQAGQFADWRELLEQQQAFDAVIVSTPDFMHAPISLAAMQLGKHVFCQKPLTHTVFEARQMQRAAERQKVVTQMGNQIQSHTAYRTAVKIVHDGLLGKVNAVHSWQGGTPSWPRDIERPHGRDAVPGHVRWDLWQGVAPRRPYKQRIYHAFNWRGWQDYGTGQLGDFGCHILDPVFKALELTAPDHLTAEAPVLKPDTWSDRATVRYQFPATIRTLGQHLQLTWYDAVGARPPRESLTHIPISYQLPAAGSVLIGELGSLVIPHVDMPKLFLAGQEDVLDLSAHKIVPVESVDHYVQWADACRGMAVTTSAFAYSGPLTETVLLGTIALRFPQETLTWDAANLKIANSPLADQYLTKAYFSGWEPDWVG